MKAIDILKWIDHYSIEGEVISIDRITEDMDFVGFYGYEPPARPKAGTYLRFYTGNIGDQDFPSVQLNARTWKQVEPDFTIITDEQLPDGSVELIFFYRIEG